MTVTLRVVVLSFITLRRLGGNGSGGMYTVQLNGIHQLLISTDDTAEHSICSICLYCLYRFILSTENSEYKKCEAMKREERKDADMRTAIKHLKVLAVYLEIGTKIKYDSESCPAKAIERTC